MYETYYNLKVAPFKLVPDHRFFYPSKSHNKAMAYLRYGLQQGEGFIVITGDIGTGKSTLVSQLFAELDTSHILPAQIATTNIGADDALRLIISAFHIQPPSADKAALLRAFETFLVEQHKAGRRVLLVVDEAQNLPFHTLEELRMLSNFSIGGQSLFQSFLLGQPQFKTLLADPHLEQLRQRVIASYHLEPITEKETREYILHRLRLAGWVGRPAISEPAFHLIHSESGGVPRRINTLCNRLLLFGALEEREALDTDAVEAVIADLQSEVAEEVGLRPEHANGDARPAAETRAPAVTAAGAPFDLRRIERLEETVALHDEALRQILDTAVGYLAVREIAGRPARKGTPKDGDGEPD